MIINTQFPEHVVRVPIVDISLAGRFEVCGQEEINELGGAMTSKSAGVLDDLLPEISAKLRICARASQVCRDKLRNVPS